MSTTAITVWICAQLLVPDPKCVDQPDCMSNLQMYCGQKCRKEPTPSFQISQEPLEGYACKRVVELDAPNVVDDGIYDMGGWELR